MKKNILKLVLLLPLVGFTACVKTGNCDCSKGGCLEGTLVNLEKPYKLTGIHNEITVYAHFIPNDTPDKCLEIEHKIPSKYRKRDSVEIRARMSLLQIHYFDIYGYSIQCIEDI